MKKREYTPYYLKVSKLIWEIIKEIIDMMNENDTNKVHLPYTLPLHFDSRFAGDEAGVRVITDIAIDHCGIVVLFTEDNNPYYLYNLANRTDVSLIYDCVYNFFYK